MAKKPEGAYFFRVRYISAVLKPCYPPATVRSASSGPASYEGLCETAKASFVKAKVATLRICFDVATDFSAM